MAHGMTNRIPFEEAADMLSRARACVAFVLDEQLHLEPAVVRHVDPDFLVGVAETALSAPVDEAVLVVDEGVLFFDLRAIYVRGSPTPVESPADDAGLRWFEISPTVVSCWDYGRLRADDGLV